MIHELGGEERHSSLEELKILGIHEQKKCIFLKHNNTSLILLPFIHVFFFKDKTIHFIMK